MNTYAESQKLKFNFISFWKILSNCNKVFLSWANGKETKEATEQWFGWTDIKTQAAGWVGVSSLPTVFVHVSE